MTLWLQRQEAIERRSAYLYWIFHWHDKLELEDADDEGRDETSDGEDEDINQEEFTVLKELLDSNVSRAFQVTKHPTFLHVSIPTLQSRYGATHFLAALKIFLDQHIPNHTIPHEYDHFDLYSRISLLLPSRSHVANNKRLTHLHATAAKPRQGTRKPVPARFDTALIIEDADTFHTEGGFAGELLSPMIAILVLTQIGIVGLRPARIRVIFQLPAHLGHFPHPLLYVEWFRPLRTPDPMTGFYLTSHSTRNRSRACAIVSADQVLRGCHLIPRFGPDTVNPSWRSEHVLDEDIDFFHNHYIDFYMFEYVMK
ncbi:hypothetical protein A0H81_07161 [Grifola frondosa]|uniref:Uncharacterized protein n=1 Tax=Grifola frondosa TaxID=5627 RepID=A0A1C7M9C2_GRIFR|nr:hypothetical protein A0H81_07161 [Grifola frondosa]